MSSPYAGSLAPPNCGLSDGEYAEARAAALDFLAANGYWEGSYIEQRVAWGDQDANQHVNNVTYLKWCEHSRLAALGMFAVKGRDVRLILASMDKIKWIRSVMYPDVCMIAHKIKLHDKRTLILEAGIYSYKCVRSLRAN